MGGLDVPRRSAGYWQLQLFAFQHPVRKRSTAKSSSLSSPFIAFRQPYFTCYHSRRVASLTAGYCHSLQAYFPADFTLWVFRWGADFLLASAEQAPASLVAAVGDSDVDHSFWDTAPLQVDVITRTSRAAINVRHLPHSGIVAQQTHQQAHGNMRLQRP